MALYIPTVQVPYMLEAMFENVRLAKLLASGVITFGEFDNKLVTEGGDYVNIPKLQLAADFARGDISSTSAITFTPTASLTQLAVVLRDVQGNSYFEHDLIRTAENLDIQLSRTVGERMAKRILQQFARMTTAAIAAIDSPSANCHIKDVTQNAITVQAIRQGKFLLGDESDVINTCFLHSKVWNDLLRDLQVTYSVPNVSGDAVIYGKLISILGIDNFIRCDLADNSGVGTGSSGDDLYHSILLGPGAVGLGFQRQLRQSIFVDSRSASTLYQVKHNVDYYLHPDGFYWAGGANPTDSDYGGANWTMRAPDHRAIRMVDIQSNGNVYA